MDIMARSSSSKLADVLKRSGLAASLSDAKRIAGDIASTESKVQSYFDKKKNEMHDDLSRRSPNRYVEKPVQLEPIKELKQETIVREEIKPLIKEQLEEVSQEVKKYISDPNPVLIEYKSAAEKEEEQTQTLHQMFEEENSGQEFIYSQMEPIQVPNMPQETLSNYSETIMKLSETIETRHDQPVETIEEASSSKTEVKLEVISEEIVKPVQESKLEIIEETPIPPREIQQNSIIQENPEPKIDLSQMFNFGKRTTTQPQTSAPQQVIQQPQVQQNKPDANGITTSSDSNHPKTGNSESVDIMEMFNFAKRGKL